jgi:ParB-like chromosome segregation protein Spo0J
MFKTVAIADIVPPADHPRNMKDRLVLAGSIERVGLLHPLVCNSKLEIIAGRRRYFAVIANGWTEVPVHVVESLDDAVTALNAEMDENLFRINITPTELAELCKKIEALEKPKAAERQKATQPKKGQKVGEQGGAESAPPTADTGKVRDKVAKALGVSHDTLTKVKQVVEAAEAEPEKFGDLPAKMDAVSVHAAHKELKARQKPKVAESEQLTDDAKRGIDDVIELLRRAIDAGADEMRCKNAVRHLRDALSTL